MAGAHSPESAESLHSDGDGAVDRRSVQSEPIQAATQPSSEQRIASDPSDSELASKPVVEPLQEKSRSTSIDLNPADAGAEVRSPTSTADDFRSKREYLKDTYRVLWDEIKFADGKATAIFALSGAMAAALATGLNNWKAISPDWNSRGCCVVTLGFVAFLLTAFCALATMVPRADVDGESDEWERFPAIGWARELLSFRRKKHCRGTNRDAHPQWPARYET